MAVSLVVVMLVLGVDDVNSRFVVSAYGFVTANIARFVVAKFAVVWIHNITPIMFKELHYFGERRAEVNSLNLTIGDALGFQGIAFTYAVSKI